MAELAREGYARHGRGCVFVRTTLSGRFSRADVSRKAKVSRHMAELVQSSTSGSSCDRDLHKVLYDVISAFHDTQCWMCKQLVMWLSRFPASLLCPMLRSPDRG